MYKVEHLLTIHHFNCLIRFFFFSIVTIKGAVFALNNIAEPFLNIVSLAVSKRL